MPPKVPKLKNEESSLQAGHGDAATWRSRFPVARIKKIMQADEDVGKVAQVVPVIISKSVELFMASMVDESSRHALATGHKRILPGHLKMAVMGNAVFDFLEANVSNVPDAVNVASRSASSGAATSNGEEKRRKSRTKRPTEQSLPPDHGKDDTEEEEEQDIDQQPSYKRIRSDDIPRSPLSPSSPPPPPQQPASVESVPPERSASRTMSIANIMS